MLVFLNHWFLWSNFARHGGVEPGLHRGLEGLYHAFIQLTWPTGGQHPAVICFFVLSGFCVHGPFERRIGQGKTVVDWRAYFARRSRRIMPVYWTGALLGVAAVGIHRWHPTGDPLLMLHTVATPAQLTARLGGWGGLWPEEIFAGNYTLGTVGVEILIYVFYPLFFLAAAAGRWWLLGVIAVGLQFLALALRHIIDPFVLFSGILVMALFWFLGALAAHLRHKQGWQVSGWWVATLWALFLGLQQTPHFFGLSMIKQLVWGLICMGGIVWLIDWERRHEAKRELGLSRFLRWTGDVSYPLYAVHTPVMLLTNWWLLSRFAEPSYGWQLSLNLLVPVAISVVVHYGIERRFYRPRDAA
jgi:peptidoglycan/LPS O-acetylase OafA/YrhL